MGKDCEKTVGEINKEWENLWEHCGRKEEGMGKICGKTLGENNKNWRIFVGQQWEE